MIELRLVGSERYNYKGELFVKGSVYGVSDAKGTNLLRLIDDMRRPYFLLNEHYAKPVDVEPIVNEVDSVIEEIKDEIVEENKKEIVKEEKKEEETVVLSEDDAEVINSEVILNDENTVEV